MSTNQFSSSSQTPLKFKQAHNNHRELLERLHNNGIMTTPEVLCEPTMDSILPIYGTLVHNIFGTVQGPVENRVQFASQWIELMESCGFKDYGLNDLVEPDPNRTKKALTALLDLLEFRNVRYSKFVETVQQRDYWTGILENHKNAENEKKIRKEELICQIEKDKPVIAERKLELMNLQQQVKDKTAEVVELEKAIAEQEFKNEELKNTELQKAKEEKEVALLNLEKVNEEIVSSPHRVRDEYKSVCEKLEETKTKLASLEWRLVEAYKLQCDAEKAEAALEDVMECVLRVDKSKKEWKAAKNKMAQLNASDPSISLNQKQEALRLRKEELIRMWNSMSTPEYPLQIITDVLPDEQEHEKIKKQQNELYEKSVAKFKEQNDLQRADVNRINALLLDLNIEGKRQFM